MIMTTSNQSPRSAGLEFDSQPASTQYSESHSLLMRLRTISRALIRWLTTQPELSVRQKVDRFGNSYWCVYDPVTQRRACLPSEEAVRIWIEEGFFHQNQNAQGPWMTGDWQPFR